MNFVSGDHVGIGVCIPHHKYLAKSHSLLIKITFFVSHNRIKSKVQTGYNHYKRVLEAAKLAYANKSKESIAHQKRDSQEFW